MSDLLLRTNATQRPEHCRHTDVVPGIWSLLSPTPARMARRSPERNEKRAPWRQIDAVPTARFNLDFLNFGPDGAQWIGCGVYLRPVSGNATHLRGKCFLLEGLKPRRSAESDIAGLNLAQVLRTNNLLVARAASGPEAAPRLGTPDAAGALMCPPGRMGAYLFF
jgi:hypothetical protein